MSTVNIELDQMQDLIYKEFKKCYSKDYIYSTYEIHDQVNAALEGGSEASTVKAFVDAEKGFILDVKTDIYALVDHGIVENFTPSSDPDDLPGLRAHCDNYCSSIQSDKQRDALICAITCIKNDYYHVLPE